MLAKGRLKVKTIIFMIMVGYKITFGVGIFKIELDPTRSNRFFGTSWKAIEKPFNAATVKDRAAIYISCVDTAAARFEIAEVLNGISLQRHYSDMPRYWMDFGNGKDTGQVILSTIGSIEQPTSKRYETVESLPFVTEEFAKLLLQGDANDLPSCSLAESLEKQDLFINGALAQVGCSLLWQLFRNGMIIQRGIFLNLSNYVSQPLKL